MQNALARWVATLPALTPVNAAVTVGDSLLAAISKLQGQINAKAGR